MPPAAAAANGGSTDWVVHIKQELIAGAADQPSCAALISRVSPPLHSVWPLAFTPQTLVIGPFHRKLIREGEYAFSFADMEDYKLIAAKAAGAFVPCLAQHIAQDEKHVRACFDRSWLGLEDLGSEDLGYMLALDCTFIVAILHSVYSDLHPSAAASDHNQKVAAGGGGLLLPPSGFSPVYDARFSHPMRKAVLLDLLLLENQVPLFLVKKVMQMDGRYGDVEASFQEFVQAMAYRVLPFCKEVKAEVGGKAKLHLLDCLYTLVTSDETEESDNNHKHPQYYTMLTGHEPAKARSVDNRPRLDVHKPPVTTVPTATELHQAGVHFKGHADRSLSHIQFDGHTLTLPIIHVGDETERIFRNLLAFESHMLHRPDVVLSYLHFMNSLINTEEDVRLLVGAGVVSESVGNNKHVARVWNKLATNTMCVDFTPPYKEVATRMKTYVDNDLHSVMAEFRQRYLSRPWLAVSLLSGTALLVMNFVIMWYTIEIARSDSASASSTFEPL